MKNTLVVNIMGAPGAGKSTTAAAVFAALKWAGVDCELVTEYAKELVWENRGETFKDELYIFAKQAHRLFRTNGKVDVIITDRPLALTLFYNAENSFSKSLSPLVLEEMNKYNNLNIFLNRQKEYNPNGRNQTEKGSDEIAVKMKEIFGTYDVDFYERMGSQETVDEIVWFVKQRLEKEG